PPQASFMGFATMNIRFRAAGAVHLALFTALSGSIVAVLADASPAAAQSVVTTPSALVSGIDTQYFDPSVRAQDDFYRHVNGKWLDTTPIPPDKGDYGSFVKLADDSLDELRGIIEGLQKPGAIHNPEQQKIADLYASFMNEAALQGLGARPLRAEFARIDALQSKRQIPALIAHLNRIGVSAPYTPSVHQDAKDSLHYVFDLAQDGLGMPDRDYYLQDQPQLKQIRQSYPMHIERMLRLAGDQDAAQEAQQIMALETAMARVQWTRVENRDPVKTYNKYPFAKLASLAPGYDWNGYLTSSGVSGRTSFLVVSQPTYITALDKLIASTPLSVWKSYFRWHVLSDYAPYLSKPFVDEHFAFYGTTLQGVTQNRPRWQRGVRLVDGSIGEALGKLYVAQYFPASAKQRMDQLVHNLIAAYRADIATLDWMGPQTRQKAALKLDKLAIKIGYPAKWRDYSALQFSKDDLAGNVRRANEFEYNRNLHKLGRPVDRNEWEMTPQTVNAYYDPEHNEIVFPAAILQPPFFNAKADDAVNYGGIGAVIGHEISHGFDDQGSQYDADGNLLNPPGWFTQQDLDNFKQRTHALVAQYSAYAPVEGYPINGELTLGENIADNSGLAIAYKAYRLSLGAREAPVIDGMTGDQRFYAGWAQVWRAKSRENMAIMRIKSDPHSPERFRGTIPEMNQAPFYAAFDVKPGDKMYLPPDKRVSLW
ncbi:MAG TPA: M13-type metalloendopeptidase, partial [Steroidobacteraceae bacterium]|nr:M13-type metalloendopeptidase [Steroidobacteraceae bacterium]